MNKLIVDNDFLELPLSGVEFATFLSMGDLGTIYRDQIILSDLSIYFNMAGSMPNPKQRGEINEAILNLMDEGHIVGEVIGRGLYLIQCKKSFMCDVQYLPHGGTGIKIEDVKKIICGEPNWRGMLRYYLMVAAHCYENKKVSYSRKYFSDKLGISELTISKYNTRLVELGVLEIVHRKNMPNLYRTT